jgi:CRISPR-associated endoribonuclease Cas6
MSTFPDLYAFVIQLNPANTGPSVRPQGHGAQALFLDLVRQVAPDLAAELHGAAQSKPYTIAVLPQRERTSLALRVTLLRSDLFQPFTRALIDRMPCGDLRLGQVALRIGNVIGTPGPHGHPWASFSSFAELAAQSLPARVLTLEFATPTAISQGTRTDNRPRLALLPTPDLIFRSIARRWNELAPNDLALDLAEIEAAAFATLVSRYQLESAEIDLGKGLQKGFVGTCTYELPPEPALANMLTLLANAAFYLGVGMKTARGMGLCRRLP